MKFLEAFLWFLVIIVVVKFFFNILSIILIELNWGNQGAKVISVLGLYVSTFLSLLMGILVFWMIYTGNEIACSSLKELIGL